jgi:6-phospho-3-hexuloisomerase
MSQAPSHLNIPSQAFGSNWKSESFQTLLEIILSEIQCVLIHTDEYNSQRLVEAILKARRIVVHGAGRMGIMSSAFAMRLSQLGFQSNVIGEPTTLAVGKDDLLILASASGETKTVYDIAELAKKNNVPIALITARPDSLVGRLADIIIKIPMIDKYSSSNSQSSIQPMTTLSEQCLMLYYDLLVLLIMKASGQTGEDLWKRHFNLE